MDQDSVIIKSMINFANKSLSLNGIAIISPRHIMQDDVKVKVVNEEAEFSDGILTMTSGNLLNLEIWQNLPFEDDMLRKLRYMLKGFIDFLKNKTGKLNL